MGSKLTLLIFILINACYGQELRVGVGYSHLYSKQYDNLIRTYNFSRPNLKNKQPFLIHGINTHLSYGFKSEKRFKSGISANFAAFNSLVENPDYKINLALKMLDLGYTLHYQDNEILRNFYCELSFSAVIGLLNKKVNEEPFIVDDSKLRSFQVGGTVNLNLGYGFEINEKLKIAPFVGICFAPYFWEGQSEIVINQTSDLIPDADQYTTFWRFDAGVRIHMSNFIKTNN